MVALVACSPGPRYYEGDAGNFYCSAGPTLSIVTTANEHFSGFGHIAAHQETSGAQSFTIVVCGTSGSTDQWHLQIDASLSPLPLTQSDTMVAPFPNAPINVVINGNRSLDNFATSGQLTAAAGKIDGNVVVGNAAIDATFTGGFDFTCSTNAPDPSFKTAFCQQFIALAPP